MRSGWRRHTYFYDCDALVERDESAAVNVVHLEGPFELVLFAGGGRDAQSAHELPEVEQLISVFVETPENVLSKLD